MCDLYCIFLQCDYAMRQHNATARDELRKRPLDLYMNSCRATRSGERNVFGIFLQENGDVLLVTQCGIHLWGFRSDKKVVQLLIRMLLQRFCTVSKKTYYVFHSDTVLYRIASRRFVKNGFCKCLRRLAAKLRRFKSVAGRRIAKMKCKSAVIPIIYNDKVQLMQ